MKNWHDDEMPDWLAWLLSVLFVLGVATYIILMRAIGVI